MQTVNEKVNAMRNARLEIIKEKLAAGDYRLTPQRELILEILAENSDRHLSAEEIYDLIRRKNPDVGLATVYRTLELLADLKVIQGINFGDGCARYEFTGDKHHHHHLICLECGEVEEVDDDLLEKLEQSIEDKHHFKIIDHQVKFYGVCQRCQEKFGTT
ncbi:MAG: Fur family transcriptional regulator [Syntrophothermus sp.]